MHSRSGGSVFGEAPEPLLELWVAALVESARSLLADDKRNLKHVLDFYGGDTEAGLNGLRQCFSAFGARTQWFEDLAVFRHLVALAASDEQLFRRLRCLLQCIPTRPQPHTRQSFMMHVAFSLRYLALCGQTRYIQQELCSIFILLLDIPNFLIICRSLLVVRMS
ncbi:unnamed protein product, partial [Prorocentrum cordatum]